MGDYVRDEEFERYTRMQNGKIDRILNNQEEAARLAREQVERTARLMVLVTEHTGRIAAMGTRLEAIEDCVSTHDSTLKLPGRVWAGLLSVAVLASLVISIVAAVRAL